MNNDVQTSCKDQPQELSHALNSVLNNVARTWQDQQQTIISEHDEEREIWKAELLQILTENGRLQDQLNAVKQQEQQLKVVISEQRSKLESYNTRVANFKKFMDGLGKDLDALKHDANSQRKQSDQLVTEISYQQETQNKLYQEFESCATKSMELKQQALRAYQEVSKALEVSQERLKYFKQQFHEKTDEHESSMRKVLEEVVTVLQSKQSQREHTSEDIVALRMSLENRLADLPTEIAESILDRTPRESVKDWLLPYLEESNTALEVKLKEGISNLCEESGHRESVAGLCGKLEASEVKVSYISSQFSTLQSKECELREQNVALLARVHALEEQVVPPGFEPAGFGEIKADLRLKEDLLGRAQSDLEQRVQDLVLQTTLNSSLQEQIEKLQGRLEDTSSSLANFERERELLKQEQCRDVERVRSVMSQQAKKFHEEQRCKADNELKRAMSERDNAVLQANQLEESLKITKTSLQQLQDQQTPQNERDNETDLIQRENLTLNDQVSALKTVVETLRTEVSENHAISLQYTEQQVKLQKLTIQKDALLRQLEQTQAVILETQADRDQVITDLEQHRNTHNHDLEQLQNKLKDAEYTIEQFQIAKKDARLGCEASLSEENKKTTEMIEGLQLRLTEAQTELHRKQKEDISFRSQVERSWRTERDNHLRELSGLKELVSVSKKHASELKAEKKQLERALAAVETRVDGLPGGGHGQPQLMVSPEALELIEEQQSSSTFNTGEMSHTALGRKHKRGSTNEAGHSIAADGDVVIRDSQCSSQQSKSGDRSIISVIDEMAEYVHGSTADTSNMGAYRPEKMIMRHESNSTGEQSGMVNGNTQDKIPIGKLTQSDANSGSQSSQLGSQRSKTRYLQADMPRPNSGSKRVRPGSAVPQVNLQHVVLSESTADPGRTIRSFRSFYHTPDPLDGLEVSRTSPAHSESEGDAIHGTNTNDSGLVNVSNVAAEQQPARSSDPRLRGNEMTRTAKRHIYDEVEAGSGQGKKKKFKGSRPRANAESALEHNIETSQPLVNGAHQTLPSESGYSLRQRSTVQARMQFPGSNLSRRGRRSNRSSRSLFNLAQWRSSFSH